MRLPDGTILMHGSRPYDPIKAHEYYMRTRKLKGRQVRKELPASVRSRMRENFSVTKSPTYSVILANGEKVIFTRRQLVEQRAYIAKRVESIKKNLEKLNAKLSVMMKEAEEKKAKSIREANKKPTAAEKSKAARESKQYREKHKTELATKSRQANKNEPKKEPAKTDPVEELTNKINIVKDRLTAAVAKQRALTAASKNS